MTQHFKFPFTIDVSSGVDEVEENTDDEILQCVKVLLLTPLGSSEDVPAFGVPDPLFTTAPKMTTIASQVQLFEPRVAVRVDHEVRDYEEFIHDIRVHVQILGASNGQ